MFSVTEQDNTIADDAQLATHDASQLDAILARLTGQALAEKITQAARLAMARHMLQNVQDVQSAVEAENSTKK